MRSNFNQIHDGVISKKIFFTKNSNGNFTKNLFNEFGAEIII